jgi:penicillin-binding protein 2
LLGLPVDREKGRTVKKREPTPTITKGNMQVRVVSVAVLVAVVFIVLGARLWYLQVLTGDDYTLSAQATHTREVKMPAQRGVIYDRDGEVLANNVPGLNVTVIPAHISRDKVERLCEILEADKETVLDSYEAAVDPQTGNPYGSMLVKENADRDDVTYISERTEEFPGVIVNDDWVRNYPQGTAAAHVLGYTGAITQDELNREPFENLSNDSVVGKAGVELEYEEQLRGDAGRKEYIVDALGRVVAVRRADGTLANGSPEVAPELRQPDRIVEPEPGHDLSLTIDLDLQRAAEAELEAAMERAQAGGSEGSGGAIIAMNPRNGEILAMASRPNFDPQLFVGGISGAEEIETFEYLNSQSANAPFANRAIAGGYPAASTFKVFTGMAGLDYNVMTPSTTYTDTGECWRPEGVTVGCWQSWRETYGAGTHGTQNYSEAIMDSNDKFFYQVADWLWHSTDDENLLPQYYERFGFGSPTGVDLPTEQPGRVPDRSWKEEWQQEFGGAPEPWGIGDWVNMAIGQGDLLVTPVQLVRAYSAIENGGTLVTPHVGKEIRDQNGKLVAEISPEPARHLELDPVALDATRDGLRMVTGPGGTAEPAFKGSTLEVAGKSGTGEIAGKDPVNWFVGWAEGREKPLVVLAMLEGGDHSEVTAAPAVRHILEAYYGVEDEPAKKPRERSRERPADQAAPRRDVPRSSYASTP